MVGCARTNSTIFSIVTCRSRPRLSRTKSTYPLPQTPEQKAVEHHLLEIADRNAQRLGVPRRRFLSSACGMAVAFAAMNRVFGPYFRVDAAEMLEPQAGAAAREDYFIFDVQTHHVAPGRQRFSGFDFLNLRIEGRPYNPLLRGRDPLPEDLNVENYIKEVFVDSETDIACISGIPALTDTENILPPDQMVRARGWVNQLTGSPRALSHGLISPDLGQINRERMQLQSEKLKIDAWKGYTGQGLGPNPAGWWLDDEKVTYPTLEYSRRLKVKNICVHKGLAGGLFNEEHCHPRDLVKVSRDFPDLNFLVYHSGFKALEEVLAAARDEFRQNASVPWVSDLCQYPQTESPHEQRLHGARQHLRHDGDHAAAALLPRAGDDHRCIRRRPRAVGNRLGVVGHAAMADRGDAPARDARFTHEALRL